MGSIETSIVRSRACALLDQPIGHRLHQLAHVGWLAAQVQRGGIGARQHEQIVDETDQPIGFSFSRLQKAIAHVQIIYGSCAQRFDRAFDRCQRCAQFVRDIGDEIHLHLAGGLQARGHVVEGVAQAAQFIARIHLHRLIEMPGGHGFGGGGELLHGARDALRQPPTYKGRER